MVFIESKYPFVWIEYFDELRFKKIVSELYHEKCFEIEFFNTGVGHISFISHDVSQNIDTPEKIDLIDFLKTRIRKNMISTEEELESQEKKAPCLCVVMFPENYEISHHMIKIMSDLYITN